MEINKTNNIEMEKRDSTLAEKEKLKESLLSLDDVVLSKIIIHLGIDDLANLAGICKRLEVLTQRHARKHYSKIEWTEDKFNANKLNDYEQVFKHFGKHINTVKLSCFSAKIHEALVIIASNCKQLETLILDRVVLDNPFLLEEFSILEMFSRLKRFELIYCYWTLWCPLKFFFGDNSTLEKLSIVKCNASRLYNSKLQLTGFQALKDLQLIHCRDIVSQFELEEFFRYNNITNLAISDVTSIVPLASFLVDYLFDKVESLSIDFDINSNIDQLVRFSKLKILRLRCREEVNVDHLLLKLGNRSNNIIEELEIKKIIISRTTIEALQNFNNLKRFRLDRSNNQIPRQFFWSLPKILPQLQVFVYTHGTITDYDILYLLRMMPKLSRLSLFGCNQLANETFSEMEKILLKDCNRPKLELIPPKFETFQSLKNIEIFTKILVGDT